MKLLRIIVPVFSLAVLLNACNAEQAVKNKQLHDSKGQVVDLTKHPGKYLVVNYWASWCGSCKTEIPEINQFYKHNKDKTLVYGYEFDGLSADALNTLIKKHGVDFPQLLDDPTKTLKLNPVGALPVTFVFDEKNNLVQTLMGPQTEATLEEAIKP